MFRLTLETNTKNVRDETTEKMRMLRKLHSLNQPIKYTHLLDREPTTGLANICIRALDDNNQPTLLFSLTARNDTCIIRWANPRLVTLLTPPVTLFTVHAAPLVTLWFKVRLYSCNDSTNSVLSISSNISGMIGTEKGKTVLYINAEKYSQKRGTWQ